MSDPSLTRSGPMGFALTRAIPRKEAVKLRSWDGLIDKHDSFVPGSDPMRTGATGFWTPTIKLAPCSIPRRKIDAGRFRTGFTQRTPNGPPRALPTTRFQT